jgi:zinc D-Ala-D-Ala carboxypeptidase
MTSRKVSGPAVLGLVVVTAMVALLYQSASLSSLPFGDVVRGGIGGTSAEADGALPEGVTVFDDRYPGVSNLDRRLLRALRELRPATAS